MQGPRRTAKAAEGDLTVHDPAEINRTLRLWTDLLLGRSWPGPALSDSCNQTKPTPGRDRACLSSGNRPSSAARNIQ